MKKIFNAMIQERHKRNGLQREPRRLPRRGGSAGAPDRPQAPNGKFQCPWCDFPKTELRQLGRHVSRRHPNHWKGSVYASLPTDFDYGRGPLHPEDLASLIKQSQYAATSRKRKKGEKMRTRGMPVPEFTEGIKTAVPLPRNSGGRPVAPKDLVQCPWCDHPPRPVRTIGVHIHSQHPEHWKGNSYASLPEDFVYGEHGQLTPDDRRMLIANSEYASKKYHEQHRQPRRPYKKRQEPSGNNGQLTIPEQQQFVPTGMMIPPRAVRYCPCCGWRTDVTLKAQEWVDSHGTVIQ